MAINLTKGQTINLEKSQYDLSSVTVGLGWDVKKTGGFLGGFGTDGRCAAGGRLLFVYLVAFLCVGVGRFGSLRLRLSGLGERAGAEGAHRPNHQQGNHGHCNKSVNFH